MFNCPVLIRQSSLRLLVEPSNRNSFLPILVRKHRRQQTEDKVKKPPKKGHDEERDTAGPPQPDPDDIKWASFDPDDPLPDFSFANSAKYQKSELLKDIDDLKWTSTPSWAIKALRRGVGVHHAGMSKGYRTTIERFVPVL